MPPIINANPMPKQKAENFNLFIHCKTTDYSHPNYVPQTLCKISLFLHIQFRICHSFLNIFSFYAVPGFWQIKKSNFLTCSFLFANILLYFPVSGWLADSQGFSNSDAASVFSISISDQLSFKFLNRLVYLSFRRIIRMR